MRQCRPFTVLDACALVAATIVGFALSRQPGLELLAFRVETASSLLRAVGGDAFDECTFNVLMSFSLAFAALRLRRPRQPFRRIATQPGANACLMASLVLLLSMVSLAPRLFKLIMHEDDWLGIERTLENTRDMVLLPVGYLVGASWITLGLARRCRAEPGWIDRYGTVIGVMWITTRLIRDMCFYS